MKKVSKWKRAIKRGHKRFFVFNFRNFKLVLIDSELNSALENQTYFYKKIGAYFYKKNGGGTEKSNQTWKNGLKFYKNDLWKTQNWKVLEPNFFNGRCLGTVLVK